MRAPAGEADPFAAPSFRSAAAWGRRAAGQCPRRSRATLCRWGSEAMAPPMSTRGLPRPAPASPAVATLSGQSPDLGAAAHVSRARRGYRRATGPPALGFRGAAAVDASTFAGQSGPGLAVAPSRQPRPRRRRRPAPGRPSQVAAWRPSTLRRTSVRAAPPGRSRGRPAGRPRELRRAASAAPSMWPARVPPTCPVRSLAFGQPAKFMVWRNA